MIIIHIPEYRCFTCYNKLTTTIVTAKTSPNVLEDTIIFTHPEPIVCASVAKIFEIPLINCLVSLQP